MPLCDVVILPLQARSRERHQLTPPRVLVFVRQKGFLAQTPVSHVTGSASIGVIARGPKPYILRVSYKAAVGRKSLQSALERPQRAELVKSPTVLRLAGRLTPSQGPSSDSGDSGKGGVLE